MSVSSPHAQKVLSVAIVEGGPSSEACVSRVSAAGVAGALESAAHRATRLALDPELPGRLLTGGFDVVFPVVHGAMGEDGCLQGVLEILRLPYVGSGVLASALACDKIAAKRAFRDNDLPVAEDAHVVRGEDLVAAARRVRETLGRAVVVKPHAQGSAIGVSCLGPDASDHALAEALAEAVRYDETALCERFVRGAEFTCGVLDAPSFGPVRALPVTEIRAKAGAFYDFRSKYAPGGSEHICPASLPEEVARRIQDLAVAAHRALGCRDLSRVDFIVEGSALETVVLLEVNTMPGMTPTSLYPEAARVSGITMSALCDGLVRSAFERGLPAQNAAIPMPV